MTLNVKRFTIDFDLLESELKNETGLN